jgi:hypothetical protein
MNTPILKNVYNDCKWQPPTLLDFNTLIQTIEDGYSITIGQPLIDAFAQLFNEGSDFEYEGIYWLDLSLPASLVADGETLDVEIKDTDPINDQFSALLNILYIETHNTPSYDVRYSLVGLFVEI